MWSVDLVLAHIGEASRSWKALASASPTLARAQTTRVLPGVRGLASDAPRKAALVPGN